MARKSQPCSRNGLLTPRAQGKSARIPAESMPQSSPPVAQFGPVPKDLVSTILRGYQDGLRHL
jgi:hypothetical protein